MKKTAFYFIALACLGVAAVSCSKEEPNNGNAPKFKVTLESTDAKTTLNGENLTWTTGDQVAIFGTAAAPATYSATEVNGVYATLVSAQNPGDAPYTAIYPASIATSATTVTLPAEQHSVSGELTGFPMIAQGASTTLNFYNPCSVLRITMTKANTSISKIQIVTDQYINGDFTIDYNDAEPTIEYNSASANHAKVTTLTFDNPVDISQTHAFYAYLPTGTYDYFMIKFYDADGNIFTRTTTDGITFPRSRYLRLNIGANVIHFNPGDLTGKFSVSSTQQVTFSKGNLYKSGSSYYFADVQTNRSSANSGSLDHLFEWTSNMATSYPVQNGGNNTWFVLTKDQWEYMVKTRPVSFNTATDTYNNRRCLAAMVTNSSGRTIARGVILFPDLFYWPLEQAKLPVSNKFGRIVLHWDQVPSFTNAEWALLEAAGCVFLPATAKKDLGSQAEFEVSSGYYWTATGDSHDAYYVRFASNSKVFDSQDGRIDKWGCAIRMVKNAQ